MRSSKQLFFFVGIVTQVAVLCFSLFYLHNVNQKGENDFEEEMFSSLPEEKQDDSLLRLPFNHYVLGEGRVLPSSGYIEISPGVSGEISQVNIKPGDYVKEGDLLFAINDTEYKYAMAEKTAKYEAALASLELLQEGPSQLILEAKEKEVQQARIHLSKSEDECSLFKMLLSSQAVTEAENKDKVVNNALLQKDLEKVLVEYASLSETASASELAIQKANIKHEEAKVQAIQSQFQKCQSHSPISGRIFAVNIHKGERVTKENKNTVIMGTEDPLHLKVHIDEKDAWRISPTKTLRAIAVHKSNPKLHFILSYVSLTPLLNKNESNTRKLELTFSFDKAKAPIYLEEMLDVYIESAAASDTECLDYQFSQLRE